ncbi:MAG TPA: ribulose-phosphate 3-epimerase [Alphaproteobacteria bacterium]|nr:ribulose-phosphate 3-epimerase [Alphaproteobacteria bacterium]
MMRSSARQLIEHRPSLSVGIVAADLLRLGEELEALRAAGIQLVHIDVMDGIFCPQMTVGPMLVRAVPDCFVKDVHLMVDEPLGKVHSYVEAGAGIVTFHVEATRHPYRVLQSLAGVGVIRGVALNPGTPISVLEPLLDELELVLLLAVNPGWSGQSFIPSTERRLGEARALLRERDIVVAVDGGITRANVERVSAAGADMIVAGSAVFDGAATEANARALLDMAQRASRRGRVTEVKEEA